MIYPNHQADSEAHSRFALLVPQHPHICCIQDLRTTALFPKQQSAQLVEFSLVEWLSLGIYSGLWWNDYSPEVVEDLLVPAMVGKMVGACHCLQVGQKVSVVVVVEMGIMGPHMTGAYGQFSVFHYMINLLY